MNRRMKAPVMAVLLILCLALLFGCVYLAVQLFLNHQADRINGEISFTNSIEIGDVYEQFLSAEELAGYESAYAAASGQYYKEAFTERHGAAGAAVYNAVFYALDHSYAYIAVPLALSADMDLMDAVYYAVYDHPLLEENSTAQLFASEQAYFGRDVSRRIIYLPSISAERLQGKEKAVEIAGEIVADMPAGTDAECARYLYHWIVENVRYTESADYNSTNPNYLYDAFVEKETNCDGFSNAYTLLMNLAGVECFNVSDAPAEGEVGHTWNILKLDGKYYHADPTAEAVLYQYYQEDFYLYFARSAEAVGNGVYEERIRAVAPPCIDQDRDLDGIELYIKNCPPDEAGKTAIDAARQALENGRRRIVLRCDAFPDYTWAEQVQLVEEWMTPCAVDLTVCSLAPKYCVIYRGMQDFS